MAGSTKLLTSGGGGVILTPASSIASDVTVNIQSVAGTLPVANTAGTFTTANFNSASTFGFRNRIINGAMQFAQRGTSFSTPATGSYTLDRWVVFWGGAAPATVAQVAGPAGFRNATQITGAASNTNTVFQQRIESYNCSDLSGATITIQANIAVSSAQTVQWLIGYAGSQDNYTSAPTITSGTWSATSTATTFTATITGLPSGVTNGIYLNILPNNGGAFTSGTITITGVQLEVGAVATGFDWRPYGTELALCQRYYQIYTTPHMSGAANGPQSAGRVGMNFIGQMRTAPTSVVGLFTFFDGSGVPTMTATTAVYTTATTFEVDVTFPASSTAQFRPIVSIISGSATLQLSAEL